MLFRMEFFFIFTKYERTGMGGGEWDFHAHEHRHINNTTTTTKFNSQVSPVHKGQEPGSLWKCAVKILDEFL